MGRNDRGELMEIYRTLNENLIVILVLFHIFSYGIFRTEVYSDSNGNLKFLMRFIESVSVHSDEINMLVERDDPKPILVIDCHYRWK